jgi:hypothetical protein
MPITPEQLAAGANYQLMSYAANDPIDQISTERVTLSWLISNKVESVFGNGIFNEKVFKDNDSNFQAYSGDDQVTYNRRDPVRLAPFQHYEFHDGFGLNETELANNGIILDDDRNAKVTESEKIQIVELLKVHYTALKNGIQDAMAIMFYRDGTQNPKEVPGIDHLIAVDPTTGTVGGIDRSVTANSYWRNNVSLNIASGTAGVLETAMETMWRACTTFGGTPPDFIVCGSKFYDAYRANARATIDRQMNVPAKGGVGMDMGIPQLNFRGVPIVWDPILDKLEALDAGTPAWDKRCYFLNSKHLKLRPFRGRWMVNRKPSRMYDRYVHYFGQTSDCGLTINKANSMALLAIA